MKTESGMPIACRCRLRTIKTVAADLVTPENLLKKAHHIYRHSVPSRFVGVRGHGCVVSIREAWRTAGRTHQTGDPRISHACRVLCRCHPLLHRCRSSKSSLATPERGQCCTAHCCLHTLEINSELSPSVWWLLQITNQLMNKKQMGSYWVWRNHNKSFSNHFPSWIFS